MKYTPIWLYLRKSPLYVCISQGCVQFPTSYSQTFPFYLFIHLGSQFQIFLGKGWYKSPSCIITFLYDLNTISENPELYPWGLWPQGWNYVFYMMDSSLGSWRITSIISITNPIYWYSVWWWKYFQSLSQC